MVPEALLFTKSHTSTARKRVPYDRDVFPLSRHTPANYSYTIPSSLIEGPAKCSFLPARGQTWKQVTRRGRRTSLLGIPS
jgi:hypothetical protein